MRRHGPIVRPGGKLGATFNPAAIKREKDGKFVLMVRSVPKGYTKIGNINEFDDAYTSQLSLWEGDSPTRFKLIDEGAVMPGEPFDKFGVEDPRITKLGDTYYIFYTSLAKGLGQPDSAEGVRIAMASTKDFRTFKKHGVIGPDRTSKAGVIFEANGKLHFMWKDEQHCERTMMSPVPDDFEDAAKWQEMWKSRDIEQDVLLEAQDNVWERFGIEPGAPPIETDKGLLVVYSSISEKPEWTISLMLLDKDDPTKIISKTDAPFLKPEEDYELSGDVNNVVFPCGAVIDNDRLYVYYGGADTVCAVASEDMDAVWKSLKPFTGKKDFKSTRHNAKPANNPKAA